tara:strand:+ start:498 stop:809 length:312 start_codon:yes stop_codon:yes gene_type:complete
MKKLKPVHDKIIVKPLNVDNQEERTESGIILPDTVSGGSLVEGEVLFVSEGMYSQAGDIIPLTIKVGDVILYHSQHRAQEYKLNGEEVLIMSQNEVMSILEEE